jgi:hypothetical protein
MMAPTLPDWSLAPTRATERGARSFSKFLIVTAEWIAVDDEHNA